MMPYCTPVFGKQLTPWELMVCNGHIQKGSQKTQGKGLRRGMVWEKQNILQQKSFPQKPFHSSSMYIGRWLNNYIFLVSSSMLCLTALSLGTGFELMQMYASSLLFFFFLFSLCLMSDTFKHRPLRQIFFFILYLGIYILLFNTDTTIVYERLK